MSQTLPLDCRDMEPPEPMIQILYLIQNLAEGDRIQMLHRMIPHPLFPKLQEKGCSYTVEGEEPNVTIWIWKTPCTKESA